MVSKKNFTGSGVIGRDTGPGVIWEDTHLVLFPAHSPDLAMQNARVFAQLPPCSVFTTHSMHHVIFVRLLVSFYFLERILAFPDSPLNIFRTDI